MKTQQTTPKPRSIRRILLSQNIQMGTTTLRQPLPMGNIQQVDPFLLLHHFGPKTQWPNDRHVLEVGAHPHRGFEPVTFIFKGEIHHKDSRGNDSLIQAGGVQWMTAGRGIVHSEGISKAFHEKGGDLEIIQLWINLPAVHKMVQPRYQGFQADEIPHFISEDGKARLNVISGNYADLKGAVDSLTGITAYTIDLKAGGKINITEPVHRSAILYQLWGTAEVNGVSTGDTKLVVFQQDGDQIELVAQTDSTLLYLSGDPINEEVTQYGPFVMNTQTEVLEAMRDYQMGKMGILI